jgi:hypothetical protein
MAVRGRETHSWLRKLSDVTWFAHRGRPSRVLVGMPLSLVEQLLRFVNLFDVLTRPFP